jgi:hypothetical protein
MLAAHFNQVFGPFGNLIFWTEVFATLFALGFDLWVLRQIIKMQKEPTERNRRLAETTVMIIFSLAILNLPGLIVTLAPDSAVAFENNWLNFSPLLLGLVAGIVALSIVLPRVKR